MAAQNSSFTTYEVEKLIEKVGEIDFLMLKFPLRFSHCAKISSSEALENCIDSYCTTLLHNVGKLVFFAQYEDFKEFINRLHSAQQINQ